MTNSIAKATATITITPYTSSDTTYDSNSHTATGTATGVGNVDLSGNLILSGTTHTNAGIYTGDAWSFTGGTNYNDASGTVTNSIAKATATITITPYTSSDTTYDSNSHTATGTATGVGNVDLSGNLILSGTTHTNAGIYTGDAWSFTGGTNYNDASGTVTNSIAQATATITVTPYTSEFNGNTHTATGTATGVGGVNLSSSLTLIGTTHTSTGVYANDVWTFHDVSGNYLDASGTVRNQIGSLPAITSQPADTTVSAGATTSFTVIATGSPTPTIQWQVSTDSGSTWSDLSGATLGTYSVSAVKSMSGSQYRAVLTNDLGSITTSVASLTVNWRSFSLATTFSTTVFMGLNTGAIKLVDVLDSIAISLPTTYVATINWGDGSIDTNVAVSHPNTDGTTIHVMGSHTYKTSGTYRPIITLVDATGSTLTTVSANTANLIVGTNVSNKISVIRSSPIKNRTTGFWAQTVTINNISGVDLKGNIDFVLIGLTADVLLSRATGSIAGGSNPYVRFSTAGLKAGKSISLVLNFVVPISITSFNYRFDAFNN